MADPLALICPIRGQLKVAATGSDGLTPLEEKHRIDAIRHLLNRGYPPDHFLIEPVVKVFGSAGKNSLRADMAVLDVPVDGIKHSAVDEVLARTVLLGEVKRDSKSYEQAKNTQVRPMLDFASRTDCVGLYWNAVERRVFWRELKGKVLRTNEGPLSLLPAWGNAVTVHPLTSATIAPSDSLVAVFDRLEDILHQAPVAQSQRPEVILQLLLAKLFDEHAHEAKPTEPLGFQDFVTQGTSPQIALGRVNALVSQAVGYYGKYLPKPVGATLPIDGETVREVCRVLAPVKIIASKHSVVQDFYMRFAKGLYRWELGQYFTPTTVTDFIVQVLNPQFGEHVKDPACGSADFLTAAYRIGREFDKDFAAAVSGADNSDEAVQVAVLNMLLNGDGKTNIVKEDSLRQVEQHLGKYDILVCNPPFGTRIVERRKGVLVMYDLGHAWTEVDGEGWNREDSVLPSQETGILFVENCVQQTKPGGRIGIIFPNGYLGNRGPRYRLLRHWLLRHCRVAAICAFPRFTFKSSGADVSASIVYLEKRKAVLNNPDDDPGYVFAVEVVERVGWNVGTKRAEPVYQRDNDDGAYLVDTDGEFLLAADFTKILADIDQSPAANVFPWLHRSIAPVKGTGWAIAITDVLNEPTLCLDPKRHCRKVRDLRASVEKAPNFQIGAVARSVPQMTARDGTTHAIDLSGDYRYVQIEDMTTGDFRWTDSKGWELPDRAKHFAEPGDIFVGSIWGSVDKWFICPKDASNLIVTNGCHRLAMRDGTTRDDMIDLVAGLCSEAYATQMRALARGSDGLAEVAEDDMMSVILPSLTGEQRQALDPFVQRVLDGRSRLDIEVRTKIAAGELPYPQPTPRPTHSALV